MKTIVQLSDLHFGKVDNEIVAALQSFVLALKPSVLVVSGDLTQRAKETEFLEAKNFLSNFTCPKVIVPGNHDVPLYNLWQRFKQPYKKFKAHVHPELETFYTDQEVAIIGLNTSRSLVFKGGRISANQVFNVLEKLANLKKHTVKIVVTHHSLKEMNKQKILKRLVEAGVTIFLSGHIHKSSNQKLEHVHNGQNHSALLVEAGTATSLRYRNEPNAFNVLLINNGQIIVDRYFWDTSSKKFVKIYSEKF